MSEHSTTDWQHNVNYTHNPYVRQTVQSPPSNNILNTYTTRRDYMAYLRKQKSPWNNCQKIFGNYLSNFKANLTKMATKMQKSFDDNNRVSWPNYQPQKATKTTTQIKNLQHIRMTGEGLGNGSNKHLRENLNSAANNVKTMIKGHQAAKKVRNYLKNPEKEKHRGQNKEQYPEFLQGFSNFIHHPREAVHKVAHQVKYGFTALQDRIARFNRENSEPNSPQKVIDFKTLQTPENGVNLEGRVNTSTPVKSGDVAPTVPHANVPRMNNIRGPVVETHISADPVANYEELAKQDAQRDYLEQQAHEAEPEEPQMEIPEPKDEYAPPEPKQSKLDERNDRKIEAHKIRKQANKNTTLANNMPNEPNDNMDSLENDIPPENDVPLPSENDIPPEPEPDPEPDF